MLSLLFLTWIASPAFSQDSTAVKIVRPADPKQRIPQLTFDSDLWQVQTTYNGPAVALTGKFLLDQWNLLLNGGTKAFSHDKRTGKFYGYCPLDATTSNCSFTAISPTGQLYVEKITLTTPDLQTLKQANYLRKSSTVISLGVSSLIYQESLVDTLSSVALTFKSSYTAPLFQNVEVGLNLFVTVQPLTSNQSNVTARFLGVNMKLGYQLIQSDLWKLSIQSGMYYTTMFVTDNLFGFQNLMGPQIFPVITRKLGANSISSYFKLSFVGQGFSIGNLSNREIAGGLSFSKSLGARSAMSFGLDASQLDFQVGPTQIKLTSLSFSVAYVFLGR